MKVRLTLRLKATYSADVEMTQTDYDRINATLNSRDWREGEKAAEELRGMIRPSDWQDDSVDDVEEFEPVKEEETSPAT